MEDARVGEDDLLDAACGRVAPVRGGHIGLDDLAEGRQLAEGLGRERAGVPGRIGVAGEAEALLNFLAEPPVNGGQQAVNMRRHVFLGQRGRLEKPRKHQVHVVRGQLLHRVLGGEVDPVEVVDAAMLLVGVQQGLLDGRQVHGGGE